jgi:hypothetical protein
MGRIIDLCGEIAADAEEGAEGLVLPIEAWDRLRGDWTDEDIEDALSLVRDSLFLSELVDAADSLSSRLIETLGDFGDASGFAKATAGEARINLATLSHLARRVDRLEEILDMYRDGAPPDRTAFDALRRRLADVGLEEEPGADDEDETRAGRRDDDDDG